MLGAKHSHDSTDQPYRPNNLAAATTEMMWACALATTRIAFASTTRGLAFWSRMLRTPVAPPFWPITGAAQDDASAGAAPPSASAQAQNAAAAQAAPGDAPAFASYRSSSGHAAAQVILPH